jgi:hypothetical protein
MPYLDQDHMFESLNPGPIRKGVWVPEKNREAWEQRGLSLSLRDAWTTDKGPTLQQMADFDKLSETARQEHYKALARDMASAQRDGFFYFNALERLKNEPKDAVADEVIDRLGDLGFMSIDLLEEAGGPPRGQSPRPFKKVLDWLIQQLAKVGKFLLTAAAFITNRLYDLGLSAVAVSIGWSPQVSIEFAPHVLRDPPRWRKAKEFFDNFLDELGDKAFGS